MRFAAALFGFGLASIAAVTCDDFQCNGEADYLYPDSSNCRYYHICKKGSTKSSEDACFIFFRKFNPKKERCDWCWNVDCSDKPPPAPTTPPPTTPSTSPPSTISSTSPPSTSSSTSPPSTILSTTTDRIKTTAKTTLTPDIPSNSKLLERIRAINKK